MIDAGITFNADIDSEKNVEKIVKGMVHDEEFKGFDDRERKLMEVIDQRSKSEML